MLIVNHDLMCLSEDQRRALIDQLDLETYAQMFTQSFESNWMNKIPEAETSDTDASESDNTERSDS